MLAKGRVGEAAPAQEARKEESDKTARWDGRGLEVSQHADTMLDGEPQKRPGFPRVHPVRAKVSPAQDNNFRGKQNKDCLGLGQQSH